MMERLEASNSPILFTGHRGPVYALATTASPGRFLSGGSDGHVVRWATRQPTAGEAIVDVGQAIFSLHAPHEGTLYVGTEGGDLHVIDRTEQRERHLFKVHHRGLFRMMALPHQRIACAGGDGSLSIWGTDHPADPILQRQFPLGEDKLRDLALGVQGRHLAVANGNGQIHVLDTDTFNEIHTLAAHPGGTTALAYHPSKPVLLSGGKDGHLRFWRTDAAYTPILALPAHRSAIYRIAFSPGGLRYATAGRDKTVKVWDAMDNAPLFRLERAQGGHSHSVNDLLWCGALLLSGSDDRSIRGMAFLD